MSKPQVDQTRYEVIVQEDNDDLMIPIPPTLLKQLGWKEGDDIDFLVDEKGRWFLRRKDK
jgi:hypothetical protein